MGKLFATLFLSLIALVIIHVIFASVNLIFWLNNGLQALLEGMNFIERIYFSIFLKWILLADGVWLFSALLFLFKRKHYKTDLQLHYLDYAPIKNPAISVIVPTFNEEANIEKVISNFKSQKFVKHVIVVDNHSEDKTVEIAERCGATVIKKEKNLGLAHSCIIGLKEALKTDANIIALTESDGSFNAYDLTKMVPYLDNCDMVLGTRMIQVLTEKGNQNGMFNTWGNFFLAKLLQIKYLSLLHMGVVSLTDVGCTLRCLRRERLETIMDELIDDYNTDVNSDGWMIIMHLTMISIENDLKIVEIPITFKKRGGFSKSHSNKKLPGIILGLRFLWYIIRS